MKVYRPPKIQYEDKRAWEPARSGKVPWITIDLLARSGAGAALLG